MKKITIGLMLLLFFHINAQNKNVEELELNKSIKQDTIRVNILMQLAKKNYVTNSEKMLEYTLQAIQISQKLNYKKGLAEGYRFQGIFEYTQGNFKEAEIYFVKSLNYNKEIKNIKGITSCLSLLGTINTVKNNYPKALDYYQQSIRISEKIKNDEITAITYVNMGVIYSEMKNFDLALKYFYSGLNLHVKINNEMGISAGLANIGNVYFNTKNYEKALEFYSKALNKNIIAKNELAAAREYGNIANVNVELENFEEAFKNYNKSLEINEKIKNKKGIAVSLQGIGKYYLEQKNYKQALYYNKKANILAASIKIKDVQKETFDNLSIIYEKLGKLDSAYIHHKKYIAVKDSIDNENNRKQISRLEIQYEFDNKEASYKTNQLLNNEKLKQQQLMLALNESKLSQSNKERDLVRLNFLKTQSELQSEQLKKKVKEKELAFIKKEIEINQKEIKLNKITLEANEKQKWFYISGIILIGIIGSLVYIQSRNRQKVNKKLTVLNQELDTKNHDLDQANKAKIRFFNIINHDLRSPVSNLIDFLHIQKNDPDLLDEQTKNRIQETTLTSAENLLSSMEDILHWSKSQMENFKPKLENVLISALFNDIQNHFFSKKNVLFKFENSNNIQILTDENYLKAIIRNLTGNAIKSLDYFVSGNDNEIPTIIWKAYKFNNQTFLTITDNGKGAEKEQFKALYDDSQVIGIQSGLGLHLIRDLAKLIDCEISVESKVNEGTVFLLKFAS